MLPAACLAIVSPIGCHQFYYRAVWLSKEEQLVPEQLTASILGAGFAAEGHTIALKAAGVDVVAMASRTAESGQRAASRLGIPHFQTDWQSLLREQPTDIVAVATPGGVHHEMCKAALESGAHVLVDKPLATTAEDARELHEIAQRLGKKTAYAASYRYQPQAYYARQLIDEGRLGRIVEAEFISHYHWPERMPYGWPHSLEAGGGRLNNNFTHKLGIAQHILGGEILAAMGECRNDLKKVPVATPVHDFREYFSQALTAEEAAECDWKEVTSDWAYTVLVQLAAADQGDPVSVTFRHSGLRFSRNPDHVAIYGTEGVLHIEGAYVQGTMELSHDGETWQQLEIPDEILERLSTEQNPTQRNWNQLACDLVRDIRAEPVDKYLTFHDGWLYQEVIDIVRRGDGWHRPGN